MGQIMKNAARLTLYHDPTRYTCQVGATQLRNGDVVVVFNETSGYIHPDFDSILLIRSTDNGQSWDQAPVVTVWPATHHFGSDTPSITQLSDGTLLVNYFQWAFVDQKGMLDDFGPQDRPRGTRDVDGVGITTSTDNGYTWGQAYKANVAPMRWGQPIDSVLELPNGSLLMACHGHQFARAWMETDSLHERVRSYLMRSDNKGRDWEYYATIAYDPANIISFDETALARTADGTLVTMMRTMHGVRNRHQHMWTNYSRNEGESWSRPEPTNLWGYPADLTLLQDGRHALHLRPSPRSVGNPRMHFRGRVELGRRQRVRHQLRRHRIPGSSPQSVLAHRIPYDDSTQRQLAIYCIPRVDTREPDCPVCGSRPLGTCLTQDTPYHLQYQPST